MCVRVCVCVHVCVCEGRGTGTGPWGWALEWGAVRAAGQEVRGQLASSVRGRWNSAGTSGRERRKNWAGGAKGAQGEGQGKGVARTLLCQLTALMGSPPGAVCWERDSL